METLILHATHAGSPVYSLNGELIFAHRHAVDELYGAPQAVELCALVHIHDAVGGRLAVPDGVVQVGLDAREHNLKHGEAAAQALTGQQVPLSSNVCLLQPTQVASHTQTQPSWHIRLHWCSVILPLRLLL